MASNNDSNEKTLRWLKRIELFIEKKVQTAINEHVAEYEHKERGLTPQEIRELSDPEYTAKLIEAEKHDRNR